MKAWQEAENLAADYLTRLGFKGVELETGGADGGKSEVARYAARRKEPTQLVSITGDAVRRGVGLSPVFVCVVNEVGSSELVGAVAETNPEVGLLFAVVWAGKHGSR